MDHILENSSTNISNYPDATAPGGGYLRIAYPKNSFSSPNPVGGTQFYGAMLHNVGSNELTLQYFVRFPVDFNFVQGGKLPGLYGGLGNTGINTPNGSNGFTTRFMWRTAGAGEVFPFVPSSQIYKNTASSNDFGFSLGRSNWYFLPDGQWHRIRQDVVLNEVDPVSGVHTNGYLRVWYDDNLDPEAPWTTADVVLEAPGLLFRTNSQLKIDGVLFQTFFGGGDTNWATPVDTYADFASFSVFPLNEERSWNRRSNYQATVMSQKPSHFYKLDWDLGDTGFSNAIPLTSIGSNGGFAHDCFNNREKAWFFTEAADALATSSPLPGNGGPCSISLLFRTLDSTNRTSQAYIFSQGYDKAARNGFSLYFEGAGDTNALKFLAADRATTILTAAEVMPSTWHFFAATFNPTTSAVTWYIASLGGKLKKGTLFPSGVLGDGGQLFLGNKSNPSSLSNAFRDRYNSGRVDEIAYWNLELSACAITNQFNATFPVSQLSIRNSNRTNIVISWPTNGNPGLVLQSTPKLSTQATWLFFATPRVVGDNFTVVTNLWPTNRFYRLGTPPCP